MVATMTQKTFCFKCKKQKNILKSNEFPRYTMHTLECGHFASTMPASDAPKALDAPIVPPSPIEAQLVPIPRYRAENGWEAPIRDSAWESRIIRGVEYKPYDFQKRGVEFFEHAICAYPELYGSAINEDDMGSGKTIQTLLFLRYHPELFPVLIIVPPPLTYKWQRESKTWLNDAPTFSKPEYAPFIWNAPKAPLDAMEGHQLFIMSSGLISKPELAQSIVTYGFKTVIFDEGHYYKHDDSLRTKVFKEICKLADHAIILTGTPVENRLGEYFNILNAVNPRHWPTRNNLLSFCRWSADGKPLGLDPYMKEAFFKRIKPYVIRRTKKEILPDLPPERIVYDYFSLLDNKNFVTLYNKSLDDLETRLEELKGKAGAVNAVIAALTHFRHLVGVAKVPLVCDQVSRFLQEIPDEKVTIGAYHELAHVQYEKLMDEYKPISLFRKTVEEKERLCAEFKENPERRLLIASIAADREGRDLQFCPNVWVAERDWNEEREKQFRGRFCRIGSEKYVAKGQHIEYQYTMAGETVDEYFHEMVTLKGHISESAVNEEFNVDPQVIFEIAKRMVAKRLKYVG